MHTDTISPPIYNGIRIVNRPDLENVMRLDRSVMTMASAMERHGLKIDPGHITRLHTQLTQEMESLEAKVADLTGKRVNIGSGDQLASLLFDHLKLKQIGSRERLTKSKVRLSVEGDIIKAMVSLHPCIRPILEWKEREKLRSTYTLSLLAQADSKSRIHTDISHTTADTGRWTSSKPNLQNIPIRTDLGNEIRNAFIPERGMCLGSVDASQIEMRLACQDSQCENMMEFFVNGEDFYWGTASLMYHKEFTPDMRSCKCPKDSKGKSIHVYQCPTLIRAPGEAYDGMTNKHWYRDICAKVTALMTNYDSSAGGLYDQFLAWGVPGWTEPLCERAIRDYFAAYPELLIQKKVHHRRSDRYGFCWELGGRIRWIPQLKSVHKRIVNEGLRQAGNMPMQGGAAFIVKLWMAIIWDRFPYWAKHGIKILLQIHDELLAEGPKQPLQDFLEEAAETLRHMMDQFYKWFNTPLGASVGMGEVDAPWGSLSH